MRSEWTVSCTDIQIVIFFRDQVVQYLALEVNCWNDIIKMRAGVIS